MSGPPESSAVIPRHTGKRGLPAMAVPTAIGLELPPTIRLRAEPRSATDVADHPEHSTTPPPRVTGSMSPRTVAGHPERAIAGERPWMECPVSELLVASGAGWFGACGAGVVQGRVGSNTTSATTVWSGDRIVPANTKRPSARPACHQSQENLTYARCVDIDGQELGRAGSGVGRIGRVIAAGAGEVRQYDQ
jgi:hypothetical protein